AELAALRRRLQRRRCAAAPPPRLAGVGPSPAAGSHPRRVVLRHRGAGLPRPVGSLMWALAPPLVAILGPPFFANAARALHDRRLATDTLVCVGVLAAYGYSAWQVWGGPGLGCFPTAPR